MQNFKFNGNTIKYRNQTDEVIRSGALVVVGDMVGIANEDTQPNAEKALSVTGVYRLPLKAGETISRGTRVFWNDTDGAVTASPTKQVTESTVALVSAGIAWEDVSPADGSVNVKINV
jgi:predicted RecA/RadA family phage recombinase